MFVQAHNMMVILGSTECKVPMLKTSDYNVSDSWVLFYIFSLTVRHSLVKYCYQIVPL